MIKSKRIISLILVFVLVFSTLTVAVVNAATDKTRYAGKKLQNGNFEANKESYKFSSLYSQPLKTAVPYWDTTAYGTGKNDGKFEFFKDKCAHFDHSPELYKKVAEGELAAELNADENTTMYQRINTVAGSTYTWGLDHRGRDQTDRMVLIIGPEQPVDPSKPSKAGIDQFVRITNWLKTQYSVNYPTEGCSSKYTVYSREFAAAGKFVNEQKNENDNISLVKTAEINQEWCIWVISSSNCNKSTDTKVAVNGWTKYGTNVINSYSDEEMSAEQKFDEVMKGSSSLLGYDCTYTVPKGQTKTLFGFCSYSSGRKNGNSIVDDKTYGNLLDDINFEIYQPISTTITPGGQGGAEAEGGSSESGNTVIHNNITNSNAMHTTVSDGQYCMIYTKNYAETEAGVLTGCTFVGAYVTTYDEKGVPTTSFVEIYDEETQGPITDENKVKLSTQYFLHNANPTKDFPWSYYFRVPVNSPVSIHLMYTKAPFILYDSNGGQDYQFSPDNALGGNMVAFGDNYQTVTDENGNVVNTNAYYKNSKYLTAEGNVDVDSGFYKSHSAIPNSSWDANSAEFVGWSVMDKDGNRVILQGEHTVTFNPLDENGGYVSFTNADGTEITGTSDTASRLFLDASHGITLTAVWKFKNVAVAQTQNSDDPTVFDNSALGGYVEETLLTNRSDVVNETDEHGIKKVTASASVDEKVMFKATPNTAGNYRFLGWYTVDSQTGKYNLLSSSPSIALTVKEGKTNTYYARFERRTVPVLFHYTESGRADGYDYYEKQSSSATDYGKYYQQIAVGKQAVKPTGDKHGVTAWYTSPTKRSPEYVFDFNTNIITETHLYAGPVHNFNYLNYFKLSEPWTNFTYGTLGLKGKFLNAQDTSTITNFNIYMLRGKLVADNKAEPTPTPAEIKSNSKTVVVSRSKNSNRLYYKGVTDTGQTFSRAGTYIDDIYIYNMKTPVWIMFDFTYQGITYTSTVKDRSLYNNITEYLATEVNGWFTTLPKDKQSELRKAQETLVKSIQALYDASPKDFNAQTSYHNSKPIDGYFDGATIVKNGSHTFTSTTSIRNIEPWGLRYEFQVDSGAALAGFTDYGAIVMTDKNGEFNADNPVTVDKLLSNSSTVMYSAVKSNLYKNSNTEPTSGIVYYVNKMTAEDFGKNTYAAFFVKDGDNIYFSDVVKNSYNTLAQDGQSGAVGEKIVAYSNALNAYNDLVAKNKGNNG